MQLNMSSSSLDILSEPDKQHSLSLNCHSSRQRQRRNGLTLQLDEAKRQIKRLNQTIEKLSQRERNTIMYFETVIKQLEAANHEYKCRLDYYEADRQRTKKSTNMIHSKLNRSYLNQSIRPSAVKPNYQNKENNMNTLNAAQNLKCSNPFCESKQQLEQIKHLSMETISILNNLHYSIKIRLKSEWIITDYEEWTKQLQTERCKRKMDGNKTSIQLVKILQQRLTEIHNCMDDDTKRPEFMTQSLLASLKSLRSKQKNLMKIPLLEKIDIKQRKQDTNCFVESAQLMKERIFGMLKEK